MLLVKIDFQKFDLAYTEKNCWSCVDYTAIKDLSYQKKTSFCACVLLKIVG